MSILTARDHARFESRGYVRLRQAFPRRAARAVADDIWDELRAEYGIERDDPATWRVPPRSPRRAKTSPLNAEVASPRFRAAIDDLLGTGRWQEPSNWGGFLVTFPTPKEEPWKLTSTLWHWDRELTEPPTVRGTELPGLLIFTFFSAVPPRGGGTLLLSGSPRLVRAFYDNLTPEERALPHGEHRKRLYAWHPWLERLTGLAPAGGDRTALFMERETEVAGVPLRVVELTGEPGDAVYCNPWMVHAPAGVNHHDRPRMMRSKFLWPMRRR